MGQSWVPGLQIGGDQQKLFVHQVADFLQGVARGSPSRNFRNAYQTQLVLDAVLESAQSQKWVEVPASGER